MPVIQLELAANEAQEREQRMKIDSEQELQLVSPGDVITRSLVFQKILPEMPQFDLFTGTPASCEVTAHIHRRTPWWPPWPAWSSG